MSNLTYNRILRKITTAFGDMFNNITLVRYNNNSIEQERMLVPIEYAGKEMYVRKLLTDPDLDKKVQVTLPRMSYILNGITYDSPKKQNTNLKNFKNTNTGVISQYNPVPYDLNYSLYLYVRNIEDGMQIIEHILPYFTPDYTLNLNMIPEMGITKEIPVVLKDVNYEVKCEGNRQSDTRVVIWTLNFTVKAYIFGNITSAAGLIRNCITNIIDDTLTNYSFVFDMKNDATGIYKEDEIVYQGKSLSSATATAKVISYINNRLYLKNITGNFLTNEFIVGSSTGTRQTFISFETKQLPVAQVVVVPSPTDAENNTNYEYATIITEAPDIIEEPDTNYILVGDLMSNSFGYDDLDENVGSIIDLN